MTKRLTDPGFRYYTAEESRAPGYLERKFARIRAEQKKEQEQKAVKARKSY